MTHRSRVRLDDAAPRARRSRSSTSRATSGSSRRCSPGVGPVPAVLLVVAADEGWMPQSAEHVDALAGARRRATACSSSPAATCSTRSWPARRRGRTWRARPLAGLPAVCVSAATGAGMDDLRAALDGLVAALPVPDPARTCGCGSTGRSRSAARAPWSPARCPRARLRVGRRARAAERGRTAVPRGSPSAGCRASGSRASGSRGVARVAVNLRGVPREAVARGDVLLTPGAWLPTAELDVRLAGVRGSAPDLDELPEQLTFHVGSAAVAARVRPLGGDVVRLRLRQPVPLRIGDRAVLRDPGTAPGRGRRHRARRRPAAAAPAGCGRAAGGRAGGRARPGRGRRAAPPRRRAAGRPRRDGRARAPRSTPCGRRARAAA